MSVGTYIVVAIVLSFLVLGAIQFVSIRRRARIIARMAPALVEAPHFFELVDLSSTRCHFLERHGPMLNALDIHERAQTGAIPFSNHEGRPVDSARWFRHEDLLHAAVSALSHWESEQNPKQGVFDFEFDHDIGEGFEKGGQERVTTSCARVIIRGGHVVTAYPLIRTPRKPTEVCAMEHRD